MIAELTNFSKKKAHKDHNAKKQFVIALKPYVPNSVIFNIALRSTQLLYLCTLLL